MSINVYKSLRQFAHKSATIRNQLSSFNICNARIPTQYCVYTPNVSAITIYAVYISFLPARHSASVVFATATCPTITPYCIEMDEDIKLYSRPCNPIT